MSSITNARLRIRKDFGSIQSVVGIPDLIKVQKRSYETFLQKDVPPEQRQPVGLQAIFKSIFPIGDINKVAVLDFQEYKLEEPKNDTEECRKRGMTYQAPVRVKVQLQIWDVDEDTGERTIRDLKEQEVYFGEVPLMTDTGTFIINGTERVVVSQLHRSPGAFFEHDKGKTHTSGKLLYSARIIPYRGSWIDFEFDHKDLLGGVPQGLEQDRSVELPAAVDADIEQILVIELEVDPGAAVRNDPGGVEERPRRVGLALVVLEEGSG